MKSPSLDAFYAKHDRLVRLAASYTEIGELSFIIKACRLKPYSLFSQKKDDRLILHRWWIDEYGNSLKIVKNKRVKIIYGDLEIDRKKITCTDLYYGLSIDKIAKMSKFVHLYCGKDEDLYEECAILTFVGIDNYLRSYVYMYGEWQPVSPLILGMRLLKSLTKNLDIKHFLKLENKENCVIPCISAETWLSFMPPSKEFTSLVGQQHEAVLPYLNTKET